MKIAVTGATGQLGRLAIEKLKERVGADDIIALARTPDKAADLGVAVRQADYTKPDILVQALAGVDTLLFISSSEVGQRVLQHKNVVEAAKAAGVKFIAYTSLLHADTTPLGIGEEHRATEALLDASGIPHAVLRNGWYTENYAASIPGAVSAGAVIGSARDGKISGATREDYAEAAAVVVTSSGHDGKRYELAGDEGWTLADLAAEISRQTGREIPYKDMPESDYAAALINFGIPEAFASMLAGCDVAAANGALFDDSRQLSALIGRGTTPLAESVARALK
ncbi:MAG TPA: SDR family oxidoreductase [Devosia sp.]|jgi:NAD(P)H dehydrogenase (quinone)|uniref:SDR family oxidoreductase n=1 Tax=Devosia sp. TaxID=1871048 RepID=UPI002F946B45